MQQIELIKILCTQIEMCLVKIDTNSCNQNSLIDDNELKHLDSLLEVLKSNIGTKEYVKKFRVLFGDEDTKGNIYITNYREQIIILRDEEDAVINIDPKSFCFIKILEICSENVKKHVGQKRYELIQDEIYYNHNVPSLIASINLKMFNSTDRIRYYLNIECTECERRCPKEMVASYKEAWEKVKQEYPEAVSKN